MADGFVPPQTVRNNAKRGLELRREFKRGGTEVGVARARSLSNGQNIPLETINRMVSYFARHEVDKKGKDWGNASNPSAGYIAWLLWGGDAGKTWANSISEREKKKEKSMALDMASTYAQIIKQEKQEDGTLLVYGKATDDAVDSDNQICDAAWLEKAMPEWFKSGGNIREQHSNIAAGVAKELDSKSDGHYITAHVVDPVSVKKVESGVLKGFSIGIRSPRVVRDNKAANGRIIDGQIVEISLVDRPANPNAKLMLAKSNGTEMVKMEKEVVEETHEDKAGVMSREDALKALEDLRDQLVEHEKMCKELGYLEDDAEKEDDEKIEEKREYGESAEEETAEGSNVGAETAEEEVEEAEGKKPLDKSDEPTEEIAEVVEESEEVSTVVETEGESLLADAEIEGVIEKAVQSAKDAVKKEFELLKSAKEAVEAKVTLLEADLAKAKSLAVGSGPQRTVKKAAATEADADALRAAELLAKAKSTTDPLLAKGYKELAEDFLAKSMQA